MFLIQLDRHYNQSFRLPLSIGNMSHIVPHKRTTLLTFGLFASGHPTQASFIR